MSKKNKNEQALAKALGRQPTKRDWERIEKLATKHSPRKSTADPVRAFGADAKSRKGIGRSSFGSAL